MAFKDFDVGSFYELWIQGEDAFGGSASVAAKVAYASHPTQRGQETRSEIHLVSGREHQPLEEYAAEA